MNNCFIAHFTSLVWISPNYGHFLLGHRPVSPVLRKLELGTWKKMVQIANGDLKK